jgi:hypothetical protein
VGEVMNEPLIPGGYIIISRQIVDSEIWSKPPLYVKVWLYLLTMAQHSQYKGLKRGQLYTSIPDIIEACSWKVGARKERPTKDQIYQVIQWLRKGNEGGHESNTKATMITTTKATHGMLINIDNYDFYQDPKNYESNDEGNDEKATKGTRKQRQPDNINKNVNNVKNEQEKKKKGYIDLPIDGSNFLTIYNQHFFIKFNKPHMQIHEDKLDFILSQVESMQLSNDVDLEVFEDITSYHFDNLPESNNGNILAFIPAFPRYLEMIRSDDEF